VSKGAAVTEEASRAAEMRERSMIVVVLEILLTRVPRSTSGRKVTFNALLNDPELCCSKHLDLWAGRLPAASTHDLCE
jgi:hypothetical protein